MSLQSSVRIVMVLAVSGVFAVAACRRAGLPKAEHDRPRVVKVEPGDELERVEQAIVLRFDRARVGAEAVGPVLESPPLVVSPPTSLRVHWQDRETLVVAPEGEWKAGQRYVLRLTPADLAPPRELTFDVQPLRLHAVDLPQEIVPRRPEFEAAFSLPVEPAEVARRCALQDATGKRTPLAGRPSPTEDRSRVALTARETLALATRYVLDCAGLTPAFGGAPWRPQREPSSFTTHGRLELEGRRPASGSALPPEKASVCLGFTTPVDDAQLAKHVRLEPAPPAGFAGGWYYNDCDPELPGLADRTNAVPLAPRTRYRITVGPDLTDTFGQRLGRSHSWDFRTDDRVPGLWTATGLGRVLEYGRNEHAAGALNLSAAELRCAALTPAQYAGQSRALQQWVFGARAYEEDEAVDPQPPAAPPWQLLGLARRQQLLEAVAPPNAARRLPLDLGGSCATASGQAGVYALELTPQAQGKAAYGYQGDSPARLLTNVTDLGVVVKRGARTALAWVTRLSNGAVVPNAKVELFDGAGRRLASGQTDATGLSLLTQLEAAGEAELFAVRSGDDVAVVGTDWTWSEGLRPWQLDVREAVDTSVLTFVHTDRGVYRPGERVYVHGLVRVMSDTSPARVPAQRDVSVSLTSEQDTLVRRSLTLNDFGSFATEIDLPKHVAPGSLSLIVEAAGKTEYHEVRVAEFRPLTFELNGGPQRAEVLSGDEVSVEVSARYLFGQPLPRAELRWTVERMPAAITAPGFDEFRFEDDSPALPNEEPWPVAPSGILLERDGTTDAAGRARLAFTTEAVRRPTRYAISLAASDAAKDRATRSFDVLAHSAERYAGVHLTRYVLAASDPVQADVVLTDREGRRTAGRAEVELRSERWDCRDPAVRCRVEVRVLERQEVDVAVDRAARVSFAPQSVPGRIHVRASTRDVAGRVARASDAAYVWSREGTGRYDDRVASVLGADRRSYAVGDRAQLALETQLSPAHLLLTAERGDVLRAKVLPRAAELPSLPLTAASAPNVFATLTGMTPRAAPGEQGRPRLISGARELKVQGQSRALAAEIRLARDRYEPRQPVTGEITVTHLGKPLMAEVALVVVNESVLQLTGFETPDPKRVFHAPRGLAVRTFSNITQVIGDPAKLALVPDAEPVYAGGEDGAGGKPELRDDYVAAAYVAPQLRTDARGRVKFGFDAPEDLSAYRLMAVVAAMDDRVGSADARLTVAQPLAAKLVAPRFVSSGDRLELGALVSDATGEPGPTDVQFDASGLTLDPPRLQVTADPAGTLVRTRGVVHEADRAHFEVSVRKGERGDRVRHDLRVRRPLDTELRVLAVERAANSRVRLEWPAGIDRAQSQLEMTVDRAGLAPLAPMLAMVLQYPYGCTEQTAAALSAIAAAPELARAIVPGWSDPARAAAHVADGLGRLAQARAPDGRFGLYPGLGGRSWLTALVLEAALALRAAGFEVPESVAEGAARALSEGLAQRSPLKLATADLDHAAHALWLLARVGAGAAPGALLEEVWSQRARLSDDGTAHLLHAAVLAGKPEAFRGPLRATLRLERWQKRPRDLEAPMASAERTSAIALSALLADARETELIEALARGLIERAADPAAFLSTRDVAEILSALSAWVKGTRVGASHVRLGLGQNVLWSGALSGAQVVALTRSASDAPPGDVWVEANGEVSTSIRRRDVSPSAPKPAFSRGITLDRRFTRLEGDPSIQQLVRGDLVQVELELRSERSLRMVALSDPLPAGLEPLDPDLSSGRVAGCESCNTAGGFDHVRRRDDHIEAFAEWLPAGRHRLRYLLRATVAGTFSAPGATATLMYAPNYFARTRVDGVTVR